MSKKITIPTRPNIPEPVDANVDSWLEGAHDDPERSKFKPVRLTFDLDYTLHRRLKRHCFDRELHISEFVRELIYKALSDSEGK